MSQTATEAPARAVMGFSLPTRRMENIPLSTWAERIATRVAKRLAISVARRQVSPRAAAVRDALDKARSLALDVSLDRAASAFDEALDEGARNPHELLDPSGFVTAHVMRSAIALARKEPE